MRPSGQYQARQYMLHLVKSRLKGSQQKINEHNNRALNLSDALWTRFQIGVYQCQLKHLKWYLEEATKLLLPATRYRHWLTVKLIVEALGKGTDWCGQLQGSWVSPTSDEKVSKS